MARTTTRLAAVVAGAALALTGCGQGKDPGTGGSDSAGSSGTGSKATPAAAVKLDKSPYCDKLDPQAMADALGAKAPMKLQRSLKPGQKYAPYRGAPKQVAQSWVCEFGTDFVSSKVLQVGHYASISKMAYTKESYAAYNRERDNPKYQDKLAVCEKGTEAVLGESTVSVACSRMEKSSKTSYSSGQSYVTYRALIDGSLVICGAGSNTGKDLDQVKTAGKKLCADFLKTVSE